MTRFSPQWFKSYKARQSSAPADAVPARIGGDRTRPSTSADAPPTKYRNRKVDGYASQKERDRAIVLRQMQHAGLISDLREQVSYPIVIEGLLICRYVADFVYRDELGRIVCEDVKSSFTSKLPMYRLKKKLMRALHGITIMEV